MGFSYDELLSVETSTESLKTECPKNISDIDYYKMICTYETMYGSSLKLKNLSLFSTEADDPFEDLGDGLENDESLAGDSGDDMNFDSFDDSSDSIFGDDFGSDLSGEDGDTKSKGMTISRMDLLDESHNLGAQLRRLTPKRIKSLIDIIDYNVVVVNKSSNKFSINMDDFIFIKESYLDIKRSVEEYMEIIDSKTFDEMFSDYIVFLSLIDKVNGMYSDLLKHVEKQ